MKHGVRYSLLFAAMPLWSCGAAIAADVPSGGPTALTVTGTNVGPIPDAAGAGCGTTPGPPLDVLFDVPTFSGLVIDVEVEITGTHTWIGDVTAELIAPGGSPRHILFGRVGATATAVCGDSSDLGGPYVFSDAASPPAGGFWQAATAAGSTVPVAAGSYFTTDSGGEGAVDPMPATSLQATFSGLTDGQAAGTWILRVTDSNGHDTGSISSAILRLYVDGELPVADPIFANGFERARLSEDFADIAALPALGWVLQNNSQPLGANSWFQGNAAVFPAHSGEQNGYIAANFNSTSGTGVISNWLVTPLITFDGASSLSFWTRAPATTVWADRLEVRLCTGSPCTDVGTGAAAVGGFTTLLLTLNENLVGDGYPLAWTQYTLTGADGLPGAGQGRVAFRYHVPNAGPTGLNSNYIGIDTVEIDAVSIGTTPGRDAAGLSATIPSLDRSR